jgi:hypothetical protein
MVMQQRVFILACKADHELQVLIEHTSLAGEKSSARMRGSAYARIVSDWTLEHRAKMV